MKVTTGFGVGAAQQWRPDVLASLADNCSAAHVGQCAPREQLEAVMHWIRP